MSVRDLAEEICKEVRAKDYVSEALAINNFVSSHVRYMRDPRTVELVKAPYLVAQDILDGEIPQLDCDDITALLAALLLATGQRVRLATVAFQKAYYQGQPQFSHVFAQVWDSRRGVWITLDPVSGPGRSRRMLLTTKVAQTWPIA